MFLTNVKTEIDPKYGMSVIVPGKKVWVGQDHHRGDTHA